MKNRRALFSLLSSSTLTALVVIACSSDPDKSEFKPGAEDAGFDTGPGQFQETDAEPKDAAVSCPPSIPSDFSAASTKLTATPVQKVCEAKDLNDYFSICLSKDANGNAKLKTPECTAWRTAHDSCSKCIEPEDLSGPVLLFADRLYYVYNYAGCVGIVQGKTEKGSCADAINVAQQCGQQACDDCLDQKGAVFTNYASCRKTAQEKDCSDYGKTQTATCTASGYKDAASPSSGADCFDSTNSGEGNFFPRIAGKFCLK